jgi:hypothetical protein
MCVLHQFSPSPYVRIPMALIRAKSWMFTALGHANRVQLKWNPNKQKNIQDGFALRVQIPPTTPYFAP